MERQHGLLVVEDCAGAHLATYKGKLCGTIGDAGCFSFQQTNHVTAGEGGMVITDSDLLRGRKLALCADKGWPREQYREHQFLAPSYHISDLQAAVALAQPRKALPGVQGLPELDWVDVVQGDYLPSAYRVPPQGIRSTYMSVEIAHAIITAAGRVGLPERDLRRVFLGNGMRILRGVRSGETVRRVEEAWAP